jgi:hypothetical protein
MNDLDAGISARESAAGSRRQHPSRRLLIACGLISVVYLWSVGKFCSPFANGPDSSGYLNLARLLISGESVHRVPRIEGLEPPAWDYFYQQPLGFDVNQRTGTMAPTYPVGFPLHLAFAAQFVGLDHATVLVNILLAAAAGLLMIALGRRFGLPWNWSCAAAAFLWACPLFIFLVVQPMSDLPAMVWGMAAIWSALRARDSWPWGFAAGFAVGLAVLVRPSNLMLVLPVAVILGTRGKAWLCLAAGGLPSAAFLAWFNVKFYSALFKTGYGDMNSFFGLRFLPHNIGHFLLWIPVLLCPLVALAALGVVRFRPPERRLALLSMTWIGSFVAFYAFYSFSGESWTFIRFLLPAFPAIILEGLWIIRRRWVPLMSEGRRRLGLPLLLCFTLLWDVSVVQRLHAGTLQRGAALYKQASEWMNAHAPGNAIVALWHLSGSFAYYTDFAIVRWDVFGPAEAKMLYAAARTARRPVYAVLFDFERESAFKDHLPGNWRQRTRTGDMSIWELEKFNP